MSLTCLLNVLIDTLDKFKSKSNLFRKSYRDKIDKDVTWQGNKAAETP